MKEPLDIARYVALVSKEPLETPVVKAWFSCVRSSAPTGTTLAIPSTDDKGMPRTVCLLHRHQGDQHRYMVPLTRDLEEDEAAAVVKAFSEMMPEGDYEIENTASHPEEPEPEKTVSVDQDRYLELCTAWAKRQHDLWFKDRAAQGWRYGPTMSISQKTNPLMLPWEQLPAQYRVPNLDEPQALLDLLNDQGYTVITKSELESLMSLMRKG